MPHIVLFQAFRHGTGKSHLTANLAVSLAQTGSRVGIIDAGDRPSVIQSLFHLDDDTVDHVLNSYLWDESSSISDPSPYTTFPVGDGAVVAMGSNLYLTPSKLTVHDLSDQLQKQRNVTPISQGIFELINRLQLDYLFIAANPKLDEENLFYMAMSDIVMLTLYLDDYVFQEAAVTVDIAHQLQIPKILLVLNQLPVRFDPDEVWAEMEQTFGEPVAGVLPFCEDMMQLAGQGIFCLHYPDHILTRQFQAIAQQIATTGAEVQSASPSNRISDHPPVVKQDPTLFDVLALPLDYRFVMHCIIQKESATLDEIAAAIPKSTHLPDILAMLIEQGFIERIERDGTLWYQSRLSGGKIYSHWLKAKRAIAQPPDAPLS